MPSRNSQPHRAVKRIISLSLSGLSGGGRDPAEPGQFWIFATSRHPFASPPPAGGYFGPGQSGRRSPAPQVSLSDHQAACARSVPEYPDHAFDQAWPVPMVGDGGPPGGPARPGGGRCRSRDPRDPAVPRPYHGRRGIPPHPGHRPPVHAAPRRAGRLARPARRPSARPGGTASSWGARRPPGASTGTETDPRRRRPRYSPAASGCTALWQWAGGGHSAGQPRRVEGPCRRAHGLEVEFTDVEHVEFGL